MAQQNKAQQQKEREANKVVATNRRARHDYDILDEVEAGIVLRGSEVKSLRDGHLQMNEGYARVQGGEVWLEGVTIAVYSMAHGVGAHRPEQHRKLLLHRAEIDRLEARVNQERLTLIPLSVYFKEGRVKVLLGLAKGRTKGDKRQNLAERDAQREIQRELGRRNKYATH
ncbi:MAG: SsrA-binding protein SmpB [Ilumatobacteraceae bacterium]